MARNADWIACTFPLFGLGSGLLVIHGCDLARGAEEGVEDSLFAEGGIVVLGEKQHRLLALGSTWVFGILQPHRDTAQRRGVVEGKGFGVGEWRTLLVGGGAFESEEFGGAIDLWLPRGPFG